ncbi:chalcone-flavanone isomerase-domain-containing protein [Desarmillaria tabescens]|uniref:Chalcone-flavanone isomerase-domain-containing protein n=1 Tax=Armillaria tabescens TaxID=1929756 RepID=A0AA39NGN8_ARMTA|nr:chalcone-flavanone isomerase-domain-containing protein [Desarmillaria tabescens]KAK0465303.1 chalcone-flavanone isomerase-domain-containing protein [Desarmillaria tabescens]
MSLLRPLAFATSARYFSTATRRPNNVLRPRHLKTFLYAGAGLLGGSFLFGSTIHLDAEPQEEDTKVVAADQDTIKDPATDIEFPTTLRVTTKVKTPLLSLVGVGVRTVSFLGLKVYSVAFYADLNNPELKITDSMTPDEKIERIVRTCACVIRIVPTRNTSFTHLRDAFVRAVGERMVLGRKNGTLSEEEAVQVGLPLRKLKTLFLNSPLKKHTPLDIFLAPPVLGRQRVLIFRDLGGLESDWLAPEFILHYFENNGVSPPLKQTVVARVKDFVK